jgi:hypothetical protein
MDKKIPADLLERIQFRKPTSHNFAADQSVEFIKFDEYSCPDCDKTIKQAKHTIRKYLKPEPHYRTRCENCFKVQDPETKQYELTTNSANRRFLDYFNTKK